MALDEPLLATPTRRPHLLARVVRRGAPLAVAFFLCLAAAAAIRLAEQDAYAGKTIVVVLPDLAERYLSSVMFAEVPTGIIEEPVAV